MHSPVIHEDEGPEIRDVPLPATWLSLFGEKAGTARFERKFNLPTNLRGEDRVFVRLPVETGRIVSCALNGVSLSECPEDPRTYEISSNLQCFNRLAIEIEWIPGELPADRGGLWQPVLLEIVSGDGGSGTGIQNWK